MKMKSGMNGDSNLSQREDSHRTTTLTTKRETTKTKDLQCMMTHAVASTTLTLTCSPSVSSHFTGFTALSCRFVRRSCVDFPLSYYELHQVSLHCHQLEEELDDWCQYWLFQNGTGLSCRSPDSWCGWCDVDNASLNSERFFNGPDVLELLREIHQFLLYRKCSACVIWWLNSFCARASILIQITSSRSWSSWDAWNSGSLSKRWWIPWKSFLMHLFLKLCAIKWSLRAVVFPYRWPWSRPFLMT